MTFGPVCQSMPSSSVHAESTAQWARDGSPLSPSGSWTYCTDPGSRCLVMWAGFSPGACTGSASTQSRAQTANPTSGSLGQVSPRIWSTHSTLRGFPEEFHQGVVYYALYDLKAQERETSRAMGYWKQYLTLQQAMTQWTDKRIGKDKQMGLRSVVPGHGL